MKAIRVLKNSFRDSIKSIFRNFSLSIASIICTTITLILVAIAIIVTTNVNYITESMEHELTIAVFVKRDTLAEEVNSLKEKIEKTDKVSEVTYISKEERKFEMQNSDDIFASALEYLDNNPLLDSFIVKVENVTDLSDVTKKIREFEGIESADYGEGMVEDVVSAFKIIKTATIGMVIALVVVTAFLISNTIKLTIFSRRSEIEIMRLVGSSNILVKLPFVFEGFLLGFIGSFVPIIITIYGYYILYENIGKSATFSILKLVSPAPFVFYTSLVLVTIGSVVGMLGSGRAVRKYLKI